MADANAKLIITAVDKSSTVMNGLQKDLQGVNKQANASAQGFGAMKTSALSAAKSLAVMVGATAILAKSFQFVKDSVAAASDLNETITKTGVIFGDSAKDIEAFASTASTALGQSKKQAMDAASTFATFGKSAGLAGKDLVGFSTDLVGLSSDLASFYNTAPTDAIQAIGAALRGESEPIRRYGVLLDDATLRNKALEMGLISTIKNALTPQQRVLAAYQVILDKTTDAQGDFARTSDGLANQQRILKATTDDLSATFGTGFLPIVIQVTKELNKAATAASILLTWQKSLAAATKQGSDKLLASSDSYKEYIQGMLDARKAAGLLSESQYELWSGWNKSGKNLSSYQKYIKAATEDEYNLAKAIGYVADGTVAYNQANLDARDRIAELVPVLGDEAEAMDEVKSAADLAKEATDKFKQKMSDLSTFMDGPLGKSSDDFKTKMDELNTKLAENQTRRELLTTLPVLTDEQRTELGELQTEYGEISAAITKTADDHELATKRMLLDLLIQRAGLIDMTAEGQTAFFNMTTSIAENWGLIDEQTAIATRGMDAAMQGFASGTGTQAALNTFYSLVAQAKMLEGTHEILFNIRTTGEMPTIHGGQIDYRASGGPVKAGYPYTVGERGIETFVPSQNGVILPNNVTNNNSTNNHFNMNVHTNAGQSTLLRDYRMLQARAG